MALASGPPPLPPGSPSPDPVSSPREYQLGDAFPNPFNPTTTITYQLPVTSVVKLKVYNLLGQAVASLVDEIQDVGYRSVRWDASAMSAGVYFYRLTTTSLENPSNEFHEIKKVIIVK
jgi:hypothetical protein